MKMGIYVHKIERSVAKCFFNGKQVIKSFEILQKDLILVS